MIKYLDVFKTNVSFLNRERFSGSLWIKQRKYLRPKYKSVHVSWIVWRCTSCFSRNYTSSVQVCMIISVIIQKIFGTEFVLFSYYFFFSLFSLMDKNYKIVDSFSITDWLTKPNLLLLDDNFDELLKGLLETPGRISQPSYNFYVTI